MQSENTLARNAAWEAGLTRYRISTPCKRGHIADRFVSNGGCTECVTRKVMKANAVRVPLSVVLPTHRLMTPEQRVELTNYLLTCCDAFHNAQGLDMPLNPSVLRWATEQGRPWTECPF
jgi:hypothetical protein